MALRFIKYAFILFLLGMVYIAFDLYRPRHLEGFQLGSGTKVIAYNIGSRSAGEEEMHGADAQQAIKLMNEWLVANPQNWQAPLDDTVPQVEFRDGENKLLVWSNIIILYSPTWGSLVKEIDPKTNPGLSNILKLLRQE
jgi:hypothetical protein